MNLSEARIGLALSGGGFRAALFHLGVAMLLHKVSALNRVKRIGAVSGGSVLAAHLVLNWDQYIEAEKFADPARDLIRFVQDDIRGKVVRRWILACLTIIPRLIFSRNRRWTFTNLLTNQYDSLFRSATLRELRGIGRPEVAFNSTSLTNGFPCFFDQSGFRWYEYDREKSVTTSETRVAFAVAASSAFPPLFPPIEISNESLICDRYLFPNSFYLTDGGVYDNLGIDRIVRQLHENSDLDIVLVSDAEGNFDSEFDTTYTSLVSRNVRASDLLMTRVSSLQLRSIVPRRKRVAPRLRVQNADFVRIGIKGEVPDLDDPTLLSPETQRRLSKIRTDLDAFSSAEVSALIAHGFSKARYELIKAGWLPDDAPRFSWDLIGQWYSPHSDTATEELKRSSIRKWRLWSFRDKVSWVTLGVIILFIALVLSVPTFFVLQSQYQKRFAQQAQVNAEARNQQAAARLDLLLARANKLNEPTEVEQKPGWQLLRLGDCPGRDIADTLGAIPDNAMCDDPGLTAVCWDGVRFTNSSKYDGNAWCTYKALPPAYCVGGGAPGRLYACIPSTQEKPIATTTFRVCIGQPDTLCPPDAVHLACGESVADWAKGRCSNFTYTTLSLVGGGRCGYSVVQVNCVNRSNDSR